MPDLDVARRRLQAAAAIADILAAAWDAFELIRATARRCEPHAGGSFAAFAMAAATAVQARNQLSAAPSLPPGPAAAPRSPEPDQPADPDSQADDLAALAATLSECLALGVRQAQDAQDGQACEVAAAHATDISVLLTPE